MGEYVKLKLEIFDEPVQNISVLKSLSVYELMQEVLRKFPDLKHSGPNRYRLYLKGNHRPLLQTKSMLGLNLQDGDNLRFGWSSGTLATEGPEKYPVPQSLSGLLFVGESRKRLKIRWQPFMIGRKTAGGKYNDLIGADLTGLAQDRRVSRSHAQILVEGSSFVLESLAARNPTYLNREKLQLGQRVKLMNGDQIEISTGRIPIKFLLE